MKVEFEKSKVVIGEMTKDVDNLTSKLSEKSLENEDLRAEMNKMIEHNESKQELLTEAESENEQLYGELETIDENRAQIKKTATRGFLLLIDQYGQNQALSDMISE